MSHKASSWLANIQPALLKASDFRVLFHLCDAHNSTRPAHLACFPSQDILREAAGLSNGGLNYALNRIEEAGLIIRRRTRMADGTKGPTYYVLGCDFDEIQPAPKSGDGEISEHQAIPKADIIEFRPVDNSVDNSVDIRAANSKSRAKPSPNSGQNHLQPTGDKPVIEPVKEPVSRTAGRASPPDSLKARAKMIRQHRPWLCRSMSAVKARECVDAGLVTIEDCRRAGIAV